MNLKMELDDLFETTFSEMRNHTQLFQSILNKQKYNIKKTLQKKIEELKECVYVDEEQIEHIEFEIEKINDQNFQEQAVFYKNHSCLNDCKITQEFIRLESRKTAIAILSSWSFQIRTTRS